MRLEEDLTHMRVAPTQERAKARVEAILAAARLHYTDVGRERFSFDVVAEITDLKRRIASADLVLTGEGRLDGQSIEGKGPAGVAALARQAGRRPGADAAP